MEEHYLERASKEVDARETEQEKLIHQHVRPSTAGEARRAPYQAAEQAVENEHITSMHSLYARRYASEAAARETIGPDSIDLDKVASQLGQKGGNFMTYDVTSSSEIASVKTHWNIDGELSDTAVKAYVNDFHKLMGWTREVGAVTRDGANVVAARDSGIPVPPALEKATVDQAADYLRHHAVLRIPDDHVFAVREVVAEHARNFPDTYGLPSPATEVALEQVCARIQGLGLNSQELLDIIEKRTGRRF